MLIVLLVFALFRTLRGVPLFSSIDDLTEFPALNLRDAPSHFGERAVSDIILSCFATIFACTWSAVHPNVPATTDCTWTRFKRQVVTMVYALLAPEAITAWALRQRLAAREIVDRYNEEIATHKSPEMAILDTIRTLVHDFPLPPKLKDGQVPQWTLAHGFFLQMGGFMLSDGGQPIQTLTAQSVYWITMNDKAQIIWNIKNKIINPPPTTEEDIQDRSKGDYISKTLIVLQTTWFIGQCIARWSNRLPVTELEVVTLGFAMLNGITYGLWWHKPQSVSRPVFLEVKSQGSTNITPQSSSATEVSNPRPTREPEDLDTQFSESNRSQGISDPSTELMKTAEEQAEAIANNAVSNKKSYLRHKLHKDIEEHASSAPWKLVYLIPLRLFKGLLRPLAKLAEYRRREVDPGDLRVPMFYSAVADNFHVYGLTTIFGILFGSVHFIASWFLDFTSVKDMWLWRASAVTITVFPIFLALCQYSNPGSVWEAFFGIFLFAGLPLYIISRIVLLTLALTSLRALPPAALQKVEWTTFIPHI